jgi:hypothetical protein
MIKKNVIVKIVLIANAPILPEEEELFEITWRIKSYQQYQ